MCGLRVAIVYREHARPGAEMLVRETVMPLCAPGIAKRLGPRAGPRDLLALPLLHSRNAIGWREWCEAFRLDGGRLAGPRFERSRLAIAAPCEGRGIVLESDVLVQEEVRAGRLVPPLPGLRHGLASVGYALVSGAAPSAARLLAGRRQEAKAISPSPPNTSPHKPAG